VVVVFGSSLFHRHGGHRGDRAQRLDVHSAVYSFTMWILREQTGIDPAGTAGFHSFPYLSWTGRQAKSISLLLLLLLLLFVVAYVLHPKSCLAGPFDVL